MTDIIRILTSQQNSVRLNQLLRQIFSPYAFPSHFTDTITDISATSVLDAKDETESTPLLWAAEHDKPDSVDYLISSGADPMLYNIRGEFPIHASVRTNSLNALRALMKHKVRITCRFSDCIR